MYALQLAAEADRRFVKLEKALDRHDYREFTVQALAHAAICAAISNQVTYPFLTSDSAAAIGPFR